jgi:NAD(P)-dependent dehydrogenase (short-subunit alcohol dehydrogenase family)
MQLATKTFVVTGAGSGIGRELTRQLIGKGAKVAGVDINPTALSQTQQLADVGDDRFKAFPLIVQTRSKSITYPVRSANTLEP